MGAREATAVGDAAEPVATETGPPALRDRLGAWLAANATVVNWVVSLVAAGLLLWAAVQWSGKATELTSPCQEAAVAPALCDEVPEFLQGAQFAVAMIGIAAAAVAAVLSLAQAFLGRRLPLVKWAAFVLLGATVVWFGIYWIGR